MPQTLPLKPIDADTIDKLTAAIDEREAIAAAVADVVARGLRNVYFVGAGGSIICSYPAHYLLQRKASFPVFQLQSDELNCTTPALMGEGLWWCSPPTPAPPRRPWPRPRRPRLPAQPSSPPPRLAAAAEASDIAFSGKSDLFELVVAFELLAATGADLDRVEVDVALKALPEAVRHAIEQAEPQLAKIADAFKDEPITNVLGSGPSYGWAYGLAMCFLQEMQWKHAAAFNTGEFFQGAFKMVDDDTAVLLWLGEDASAPWPSAGSGSSTPTARRRSTST